MNQIILRTHKGEYFPGEDIYGVIYLNIVTTTAGRGVRLTFQGREQFTYKKGQRADGEAYQGKKEYLDYPDIELYRNEEPLTLGSYVLPFRLRLQSEIPGTFSASGSQDCTWDARVWYWLTAQLIDAENISNTQSVVVCHPVAKGMKADDPPEGVSVEIDVPWLLVFKKKLFVTVRLLNHIHTSGDVLKLRLIITNETGINVTSITFRLLREITLIAKNSLGNDRKSESVQETQNRIFISPENGPHVVWETEISGCHTSILNRGLDNFCISLKDKNNQPIFPSVHGHHIQCRHMVEVDMKLQNDTKANIIVPVPCIHCQKCTDWYEWKPPDWVHDTEILITDSPFSVPENVLRSEAFSGIPKFQALNS